MAGASGPSNGWVSSGWPHGNEPVILSGMRLLLNSFWRALVYLVFPRVIGLSFLPLVIASALALGLGYFYWEAAVAAVRQTLETWYLVDSALAWLEGFAGSGFRAVVAPLLVVAMALPVVIAVSLLLVALLMTPALVSLVRERRFPHLERRHGASFFYSMLRSLVITLVALVAVLVTMPVWLIPPLMLFIPPLIWGWMTAQVMAYDALADHADKAERKQILAEHRWPLLLIGIVTGYLGAAPTLIWAFGAITLIFAPFMIVISIWLYTVVFAFSALWFAHYALDALARLRAAAEPAPPPPPPEPAPPHDVPPPLLPIY